MISGLTYIRDYITSRHEHSLMMQLSEAPWSTELKRRVQHYGFKYNYKSRSVGQEDYIGPLPRWADSLALMIWQDKHMRPEANQVIVNEYEPGQGIGNHIDCEPCFGNTICSLSLNWGCVMEFTNVKDEAYPVGKVFRAYLEPRSLLVLTGPARFYWKHGIPARKFDEWQGKTIERERRVSITFRTVLDEFYQVDDDLAIAVRADLGALVT